MKSKPERLKIEQHLENIKELMQYYGVQMPTYQQSTTVWNPNGTPTPQTKRKPGRPKKMPVAKYKYTFTFTNGTEKTHFLVNDLGYEDEAYFFTDNITKQEVTYFSHALASVTMDKL